MAECLPIAYGEAPWGTGSWGGALPDAGGPLPLTDEFNIFCVGPCGEMVLFLDYAGVEEESGVDQFEPDLSLLDLAIVSGGTAVTDTAKIFVDIAVPSAWTLECTFKISDMPSDFNNLAERHVFFGTSDRQGASAGLFFSSVGIAYVGSVRHDSGNNILLNGAMQILPNSLGLVPADVYTTIRLVVDYNTGTTYIYVTPTADVPNIGHQLKFILPAINSDTQVVPPDDGTIISVRGTLVEPSTLVLDTLCLGSGVIIPNIPPTADAGADQAARACSIVRLDGRKSFDPEGANLLYQWRLIDGPVTSMFVLAADDGHTVGSLQTNKFYSEEILAYEPEPGIVPGDVLLVAGTPYTIVTTGTDVNGFYIQINGTFFAGEMPNQSFRVLKQHTISGPTTTEPTFYPDVPGLYKFDLTVFDGGLFSEAANTVVNVTESPVPRGCSVDVRFLWNYISDFWRLVEDTAVIETFWGALAQIAASELLALWQTEYSKSLRDVQRTFQRRWLHYDLFIAEPQLEQTTIRTILAGASTVDLTLATGVSVGGLTLVVQMPDGTEHEVYLTQPDTTSPEQIVPAIQRLLQIRLQQLDSRFTVDLLEANDGTTGRLVVRAPFPFTFTEDSSATTLFTFPAKNDLPRGDDGGTVGINGYRVGASLSGIDVQAGDYLVTGGTAYRILRVVDDPTDDWENQRLVFSDNLPLNLPSDWVIVGATRSTYLDFYSSLCSAGDTAIYEVVNEAGAIIYIACPTLSAAGDGNTALLTEHSPIASYLTDDRFSVYFHSIYRRTYMPVDPLVSEIPVLQEKIKNDDDEAVLRQNIDFYRTEFRGVHCLKFTTGSPDVWQGEVPPRRMWAETTYIDNRPVIEQNFGIPAEFTLDDLAQLPDNNDYLSCVRGLWYAYFNGPTVSNLRIGTQILLGLPFAEEAGTIIEVDADFTASQGRFLIQDLNEQAIVRSYTYPQPLSIEINPATGEQYKAGDTVTQFAPLVEGVEVVDYVKDPHWFQGLLSQGSFAEVEKYFKFLVRVESTAFNLNAILFAIQFVRRIKPTYTYPVLAVRRAVDETTVDTTDIVAYLGHLNLYAGPYFLPNGQAQMFDQPRPGGGGWWNSFDTEDPDSPPVFPTPDEVTNWGFDVDLLAPTEVSLATLTTEIAVADYPPLDSLFYFDLPVFTEIVAVLSDGQRFWVPVAGYEVGLPQTSTVTAAAINKVVVFIRLIAELNTPLTIVIKKNGSTVASQLFNTPFTGDGVNAAMHQFAINLAVPFSTVPGDVFTAELSHQTADYNTYVETVAIVVGVGEDWSFDTTIGPGTYKVVLPL